MEPSTHEGLAYSLEQFELEEAHEQALRSLERLRSDTTGTNQKGRPRRAEIHDAALIAEGAARRQAKVSPILEKKGWTPGHLATAAGVAKNSVYEYLDGRRRTISDENRLAIADALGIDLSQLPV